MLIFYFSLLMWYTPPFTSTTALTVYYAVAYVVFDAAATFVYMPYFALTPELTEDYDERTSLISYRMFFSIFGSLLAFTVPLMIVGTFTPENAARVLTMAILMFSEMAKALLAKGYDWADLLLTSADNPRTPALAERIGAKIYKRYRVYRLTF